MRKTIGLLFILLLIIGGIYLYQKPETTAASLPASTAPKVVMKTLEGKTIQLEDFKGKKVYIHFWASWCTPCVKELPELLAFAQKHPENIFIAITADEHPEDAKRFVRQQKNALLPNVYFVQDTDKSISAGTFFTYRYPETIILDEQQQMVAKFAGTHHWE